ncbi:MAG: tripartite tricarboxylate transporter substrate binding protein [Betaproteobacteria bacterium]|nr:tripartite tricarboxylate transporter substrate binding protein [Betaproteobacteria bacterium]
MKALNICAAALLATAASQVVWSQQYPVKPVRLIVGFAAGGSTDMLGRLFAQQLGAAMGQQFLVENRPGATSNIAGSYVAKSAPDGYTLLVGTNSGLAGNVAIYRKMPYDPLTDFTPIGIMAYQGNVLVVNPSIPARSVQEFIALARKQPGAISIGSAGSGSSQHLSLEAFSSMAEIKVLHVPYKGGAPAIVDLLGGQIGAIFAPLSEAVPHIKNARLRALGVTTPKRSAVLADVPTIQESGLPKFEFLGFIGLVGPRGLSAALVAQLNRELNSVLSDPGVQKRYLDAGLELGGGTPEQFTELKRRMIGALIALVKAAGVPQID